MHFILRPILEQTTINPLLSEKSTAQVTQALLDIKVFFLIHI